MASRFIIALVLLPTLALSTAFAAPATAQAACRYNGFINSGGQCAGSWWGPRPFAFPLYSYNTYSMEQYIAYLQQLIELLQDQIDNNVYYQSSVDVETRSAVNIDEDSADLRGRIDMNDEDKASVYFEYGTSRSNLNKDSREITIDDKDDDDFKISVSGLTDDTLYYFRAVAVDEDDDKDYGSILSFRTDAGQHDDEPTAETRSAINITDDTADLRGSIDMNDFNNGRVFFVYGEDEGQIEDVVDDYNTYSDIDEDGEDLQKILIDSDLDSSALYTRKVSGLDPDTRIYYNICVEYEDVDNDDTLVCGDVVSLMTEE